MLNKKLTVDDLLARAYQAKNTARMTVVKGAVDRVYQEAALVRTFNTPNIPAMEAIGGTGDTITGMLTAFRFKGDPNAEDKALVLNRLIGRALQCTPATQIDAFIQMIPSVLKAYDNKTT